MNYNNNISMKVQEKSTYRIITPEKGYKLTKYKKDEDIVNYESYAQVYQPVNEDISLYREISLAEDARLIEEHKNLIK